jgi:XTP/dITP diphosphohydrolase
VKVVLASGNQGKLRELSSLLGPLGYELVSQAELGVVPGPETAETFIENALDKARFASDQAGMPAVADDSGLVVRALGGAPGIHSARYAGVAAGANADPQANNDKLLRQLAGESDRSAHFYCALVFIQHAHDPAPILATGRWPGTILEAPQGVGGFGYDPLFLVPSHACSAAELEPTEKNRLSHRGQAVQALCKQLKSKG